MPHVDEGTLHALLDGELAPETVAEVRVHFATCSTCAARLDEARQLLAETERLVSALQLPGSAAPRAAQAASAAAPAGAFASSVADSVHLPSPGSPLPPLDPVVLIPENPTAREVRRSRMRLMAWAAGFLVVVGAGYFGVANFRAPAPAGDDELRLSPEEFTTAPVPTEREGADSTPTLGLNDAPAAPAPAPAPPAPEPKAEPARAAARTPPPATPSPRAQAPAPAAAAQADEDEGEAQPQLAKAAEAAPRDSVPAGAEGAPPESANRGSAAQATSELDRRRTRERAAEATAALDRERQLAARREAEERERQLAAERAAAAAAPARPAADARAGISSRIGLDEAARQLGGPLHAIDGLTRQTLGLVPGTSVEGADPTRPVVRAVYVDRASGTMLFLDQQMARPGDGPATPQTGGGGRQVWVKDGVRLVLHGDLAADSLRSLARRVR